VIDLRLARLLVSADALVSPAEAARLIGGRGAYEWVIRHVPIRHPADQPRVKWGDVLEACPPESKVEEAPKRRKKAKPPVRLADV
jgi:hypothetical protein